MGNKCYDGGRVRREGRERRREREAREVYLMTEYQTSLGQYPQRVRVGLGDPLWV